MLAYMEFPIANLTLATSGDGTLKLASLLANLLAHIHTHMCACVHACMCACMHACVHARMGPLVISNIPLMFQFRSFSKMCQNLLNYIITGDCLGAKIYRGRFQTIPSRG